MGEGLELFDVKASDRTHSWLHVLVSPLRMFLGPWTEAPTCKMHPSEKGMNGEGVTDNGTAMPAAPSSGRQVPVAPTNSSL